MTEEMIKAIEEMGGVIETGYTHSSVGGKHYLVYFDNHYGASLADNWITQMRCPGFELAVISWGKDHANWDLEYSTPITDDVINGLGEYGLIETLREISELEND